jgi:hypothetical protein
MISVRRDKEKGHYHLRVHHMFLEAAPEVVKALGRYVTYADAEASRLLGRFIDIHQKKIRRARKRRPRPPRPTVTAGTHHNLAQIFDELNARYFADAPIDARITWGPRLPETPARRRASVRLGSFAVEDRLIRVHRTLDRADVPRFFVDWVVYHEMLHARHDMPLVDGRRRFHTPAFRADEARFADATRARRYERDFADLLLTF